jgi:hypothetical protein
MDAIQKGVTEQPKENLFTACNIISSLFYEGSKSKGRIVISKEDHPSVEAVVKLNTPVEISNYRRIRKLLEIAASGLSLLSDSVYIYGFGQLSTQLYEKQREDLFVVEFNDHYSWTLLHAEKEMMTVTYEQPKLPKGPISIEQFTDQVREVFSDIFPSASADLWALVLEATRQKHGTMIVVSDRAAEEAERLRAQSTGIVPTKLSADLMLPLSSIDGAILITPEAYCHAIGVILDGIASERGDPARGARYNSAIRYLEYVRSKSHSCRIIVISEDGMINVF